MLRRRRLVGLMVALCTLLVTSPAADGVAAELPASSAPFWLGPYFAGLRLTHQSPRWDSFSYGDCKPPPGEGGCSVPVNVQNRTSCERNPIGLDVYPQEVFLLRGGGLAAVYEPTGVDVGTGGHTVTLYTNEFELMGAALRDFRLRSDPSPQPLPPPRYPLPVLRELKRVTVVADRMHGVDAIARQTGLTPVDVRLRLRIAALLGPGALAGVPPPKMSTATVERLRQLAFRAQFNLVRTARQQGISVASLRKKVHRVRGLTGQC